MIQVQYALRIPVESFILHVKLKIAAMDWELLDGHNTEQTYIFKLNFGVKFAQYFS